MFPYIGMTDFTNFSQVRQMRAVFETHLPWGVVRRLHVGVMMSFKTLHNLPSKWTTVFPSKETVADIFSSDEVMNCLHYADYDYDPELDKSLYDAIGFGGIGINALQLDMVWPDPTMVAKAVHCSRKSLEVVLQLNSRAFEMVGNDPLRLLEKLWEYDGTIHHVLLDLSMGRGLSMNATALLPFARAIRKEFPDLGIGGAGGLGPDTMDLLDPFLVEFPDINIDAQGKLRPSGNSLDPVDWKMAETYLIRAIEKFTLVAK